MKSLRYMPIRYVVLALCVLLVASSLDSIPDPLAVTPHAANSKAFGLREIIGAFQEQRMDRDVICVTPLLSLCCFDRSYTAELTPGDEIALVGYAADPSPPTPSHYFC